jgi:branched-chain amino acid transport system permease protein
LDFFVQLFTDPVAFYNSHQLLIAQMGINSLLAMSIFVTLYSGQLAMANVGFMAIGAYTSVILAMKAQLPLPLAIAAGCLLAVAVAFVVGLPVLRLRGVFLAIATIGFGEAIRFGVILNVPITGRGAGLNNTTADLQGGIYPVLISLVVLAYVFWRITGTKLGQAWAAIREDELAAASQGIDVTAYKMVAFVLGAAVAAFAGALDAHLQFFIDPTQYGFNRAVQVLIFAVVGGFTTVFGPIVGAVILTAIPEIIRSAASYRDVLNGVILILIVIFRPQGVIARRGLGSIGWRPWRRRTGLAAESG